MASAVSSVSSSQRFLPLAKAIKETKPKSTISSLKPLPGSSLLSFRSPRRLSNLDHSTKSPSFCSTHKRILAVGSVADDLDVIPVNSVDSTDHQHGITPRIGVEVEGEGLTQVVGLAFESGGSVGDVGGFSTSSSSSSSPSPLGSPDGKDETRRLVDRVINASIVLTVGTFTITKLLTIDQEYWHGWTLFEILRYAPQHNWIAYEEALKTNPVLAKMMISGIVYSIGDWIAQCYEGKPLFEFDRARMFRSGLVGFTLHGSLSHYYYHLCEYLFPFQDWWVVPVKVAFDQTAWSALWNSIYYVVLGLLRLESPVNIFSELKATFLPLLTAGWKLWPFAHLITYGVIPVEQRLLWVDCVELIWVTILSTYSNEKSEARNSEAALETTEESTPSDS
ncbi:hypothetical protein QJS04_geneDACA022524 [Acorus gramineus]|uniref:Peroxisomal membrane protein 2 n=1 Tax=Acorus gramineus TaxID=55184 RepID=A0AAV9A7U7_ACOGR|nr:hypothetical protein QJS04_geneDACA022524 [Acorus gramineus]